MQKSKMTLEPVSYTHLDVYKRQGLYAKIANYYNTFLLNGTDQSGERGTGDFMDFYKTLHSLNQFEVTQKSTKSDLAAAYLISREITIEIMNYAEQFLKDSSINKKMLNKELEKIEERTKYFIKEKKQMEELYQFMNEAKQKIEMCIRDRPISSISKDLLSTYSF